MIHICICLQTGKSGNFLQTYDPPFPPPRKFAVLQCRVRPASYESLYLTKRLFEAALQGGMSTSFCAACNCPLLCPARGQIDEMWLLTFAQYLTRQIPLLSCFLVLKFNIWLLVKIFGQTNGIGFKLTFDYFSIFWDW